MIVNGAKAGAGTDVVVGSTVFFKGRFIALISTQHTSRVTKLFHCNNQFRTVFRQFNMDNCGAARFQQ